MNRERRIWRLIDGKAGHERQSQGLVRALAELSPVEITDLDVSCGLFRRLWRVIVLSSGRTKITRPHLLVGAGRKTGLPVLLARFLTGAKSVMLMNPGAVYRKFGDFCIVPVHDRIPESTKALTVRGVLNTVVPGDNQDQSQGLILVGGPSRHVDWNDRAIEEQIRSVVERHPEIEWTVTDSRRTPESMNESLRRMASTCANYRFYSHAETGPDWIPEQLLRCAQVWVSPDSVSMIYEALTAGSRVGVFELTWRRDSRLKAGLDDLLSRKMATSWAEYDRLGELRQSAVRLEEARRSARWLLAKLDG